MVVYNKEDSFTINHENVCTNYFPLSAWYFKVECLFFRLCSLILQACGTLLDCAFNVRIHVDPVHKLTHKELCLFYSHVVTLQLFIICFCNVKGIVICFPFIATTLVIAGLCLIGQYPLKVGSYSSLFCSHPLIMDACSIFSSTSSLIAALIFSINM